VQINLRYDNRGRGFAFKDPRNKSWLGRFGLAGLPKPMKYDLMLVLNKLSVKAGASQPVPFSSLIRQPPRLLPNKTFERLKRVERLERTGPFYGARKNGFRKCPRNDDLLVGRPRVPPLPSLFALNRRRPWELWVSSR
jgi:hypothetical protein